MDVVDATALFRDCMVDFPKLGAVDSLNPVCAVQHQVQLAEHVAAAAYYDDAHDHRYADGTLSRVLLDRAGFNVIVSAASSGSRSSKCACFCVSR